MILIILVELHITSITKIPLRIKIFDVSVLGCWKIEKISHL